MAETKDSEAVTGMDDSEAVLQDPEKSLTAPDPVIMKYLNFLKKYMTDRMTKDDLDQLVAYLKQWVSDIDVLNKISAAYVNSFELSEFGYIVYRKTGQYIGALYKALVAGTIADFTKRVIPTISITMAQDQQYLTKLGMTCEKYIISYNTDVLQYKMASKYRKYQVITPTKNLRPNLRQLDRYIAQTRPNLSSSRDLIFGKLFVRDRGLIDSIQTTVGYFKAFRTDKDVKFCRLANLSCTSSDNELTNCSDTSTVVASSIGMQLLAIASEGDDFELKTKLAKQVQYKPSELLGRVGSILSNAAHYKAARDFIVSNSVEGITIVNQTNLCRYQSETLDPKDSRLRLSDPYAAPNSITAAPGIHDGINKTVTVRDAVTFIELFVNIKRSLNINLFEAIDKGFDKPTQDLIDEENEPETPDETPEEGSTDDTKKPMMYVLIASIITILIIIIIAVTTKQSPPITESHHKQFRV